MFHILYDGTVVDEDRFSALGGEAEAITARLAGHVPARLAAQRGARRFSAGPRRERTPARDGRARGGGARPVNGRRAFRRILEAEVSELLGGAAKPA